MGILTHADTLLITSRKSKFGIGFASFLKLSQILIGLGLLNRVAEIILLRRYVSVSVFVFRTCLILAFLLSIQISVFRIFIDSDILYPGRQSTVYLASSRPRAPQPILRRWTRIQGGLSLPSAAQELTRVRSRLETLSNLFHPAKTLMMMIV